VGDGDDGDRGVTRAWIPNLKHPAITEAVRGRIAGGTLKPGRRVSIGDLAPEMLVSRKTAAKALVALEAEGLLERRPGIGYVVARPRDR